MTDKKTYRRPGLVLFGTVRNLTGGSGGTGADGILEKELMDMSGM